MPTDREQQVDEAIADDLAGCDADRPPDRAAFLAKYPDLADSLGEFLDDHARMCGAAGGWARPRRQAGKPSPRSARRPGYRRQCGTSATTSC